ncbi:hypothetical protein CLIB1444_13S00232 [[Candida] jaroonii]|uniref:Uncharacterized protein n=1 Tax=[Candida] jaroonii TaxID=467808 RepID=A0ACA9YDE9_9ASCO|nr:hypothetical protein CLIB1444_13S00232 [[Candida] jaroonii]
MGIQDLSLDIWNYIIHEGQLDITDVIRLLCVNNRLRNLLKHNSIWYRIIYDRYLSIQIQYDIKAAQDLVDKRNNTSSSIDFYSLSMQFYRKEVKLGRELQNCNDIRKFLDTYVDDDDYLPIIYNYYYKMQEVLPRSKRDSLGLRMRAVALNLLIAQSYKLAMNYFYDLLKNVNLTSPSSFEEFWFKVSLFDKGSHSMIQSRNHTLNKIYDKLHQEITIKQFYNRKGSIQLLPNSGHDGSGKDVLIIQDNNSLIYLIIKIFQITLSCLRFNNSLISQIDEVVYDKYCKSYFLEDFSLLRLYSGAVKGHPFLIMAILMKVLEEFLLSKYVIKSGTTGDVVNVTITMTSTYLKVGKYLFSFDRKVLTMFSNFEVYTIDEVVQNLRDRSYFEISKFIEPLDFKYIIECYLHLDYFLDARSLNTILRPDYYFNHSVIDNSSLQEKDYNMITIDDYNFIKLMCRYMQDKTSDNDLLDTMFCREFEASLNHLNNFIHFRSFFKLFKDNEDKQKTIVNFFMRTHSNYSIVTGNFDLNDPSSKISLSKINSKYPFNINNGSNDSFTSGQIIKHIKFDTYGIVLGRVLTGNNDFEYYRIFTTKKTRECYNGTSMTCINSDTPNVDDITEFVLKSCGEDILGLLFFEDLVKSSTCLTFKPLET